MARTLSPTPGTIKAVQRGVLVINGGSATQTATVSAVVVDKSELRLLGYFSSAGGTAIYGTAMPHLVLTNTTTVTATRSSGADNITVSWELTEFN